MTADEIADGGNLDSPEPRTFEYTYTGHAPALKLPERSLWAHDRAPVAHGLAPDRNEYPRSQLNLDFKYIPISSSISAASKQ